MLVIVGYLVILGAVLGGFTMLNIQALAGQYLDQSELP